jgi:hypothetical protein
LGLLAQLEDITLEFQEACQAAYDQVVGRWLAQHPSK